MNMKGTVCKDCPRGSVANAGRPTTAGGVVEEVVVEGAEVVVVVS